MSGVRFTPVRSFLAPYAWIYIALLSLLAISAALEALNVAALFPFVSAVFDARVSEQGSVVLQALNTLVGMVPVRDRVTAAAVLLGVAILVKGVVAFLLEALIAYGSGRVVYETKQQIFTRYSQAQYQFFIDHHQGDLTYRVATAPQSLGLMLLLVPYSLTQLFTVAFIGVLLATIDWRLTVGLAAIGLPFYGLIRTVARRVSYMTGKGRARALANELGLVSELVGGIKEIRANLATGRWARLYAQESQAFRRLYVRDMIWQSVPGILIELVTLSLMGAAVLVYRLTVGGPITSGLPALAVFAYAIHRLIAALSLLSRYRLRMGGLLPDVELLYTTLHTSAPAVRDGPRRDVVFSHAITFDNVSFVYPHREEHAVYDITLTIPKGRVTGIVGPSGSGKTTLINLLLRLYDPTHGVILVDDTNLAEYRRDAWLHRIGYVSQETFLFSGSVEDNIRFGREATREGITAAAMAARAHEFIVRLPQGYDTLVGDRGMTLSGGQRQRIAIARALLRQPQVLIFDEATSAVDAASEAMIQRAIAEMSHTITVILIAHRLSTVVDAHQIVVLDRGRVVEMGTHRELLRQGGQYARLAAGG